jgi:hypothetical protein
MDTDTYTRKRKIECKPELVISSLQRFYSSHPEIEKVITYLNGEAPISLRIIDWFVTKYSRKNFIRYPLNGQEFLVYLSYKGQLKAYSKQYFDPNCRRERIMFKIPGHEQFMTTIGKLNFFRWALESKILDYIEAHAEEIRTGYNTYLKDTTQTQKRAKSATASSTESTASGISAVSDISTDSLNTIVSDISAISSESDVSMSGSKPTTSLVVSNAARVTRRRRTKQTPSALNKLQVFRAPIELDFS